MFRRYLDFSCIFRSVLVIKKGCKECGGTNVCIFVFVWAVFPPYCLLCGHCTQYSLVLQLVQPWCRQGGWQIGEGLKVMAILLILGDDKVI